jgi:hypothetical protein
LLEITESSLAVYEEIKKVPPKPQNGLGEIEKVSLSRVTVSIEHLDLRMMLKRPMLGFYSIVNRFWKSLNL